mgnify:CR=1 FL=1
MVYVVYATAIIIMAFSAYQIYKIRKNGDLTEQGWAEIRIIAYQTIDDLMKLYQVKSDKEKFIQFVVDTIRSKIVNNENLTDVDKNFWTNERLTAIFKPVIEDLINQIESKHVALSAK